MLLVIFKDSFEKNDILFLFNINKNDFWIYFLDNKIYFIFDSKRLLINTFFIIL